MYQRRFSLNIKGSFGDAVEEIRRRGFRLVFAVAREQEVTCVVEFATYFMLQEWFNQSGRDSPPYPPGTLLHFTPVTRNMQDG